MDFLVQQAQRIARERAELEAQGIKPPPLPDFLDPDKMMDDATDWVKDQFTTKEEKEAKSRKKREEIEERERKEREAAAPTLADMFSGFKFGSGAPVKMAQPDYYKEHRNIVGLLNRTGKALLKEGKDQQKEATAMAKKLGARNPFYHMQGAGFGPDGEFIPPTIEDIKKHYDKPNQPPPVFDDEPEELMMQRYYYSQKAPGKYRPDKKRGGAEKELNMRKEGDDHRNWGYDEEEEVEAPLPEQPQFVGDPTQFKPQPYDPNNPLMFMVGGMINPFDKDGNLLPQFQQPPPADEFDWIENERRTTNPFYHLQGTGQVEDFINAMDNPYTKDKLTKGAISGVSYLGSKILDHLLKGGEMPAQLVGSGLDDFMNDLMADIAKDGIKKGMEIFKKLKGSGWEDDLNAFVGEQLGKLLFGGIAHNPKGHTTRNNNLTKQKPQKKKFCGFVAKKFAHEDYDPAKMHKFRAATCGGKPLPIGGRPEGAKNKQGYVKSGEFTEGRKRYGQSKQFRVMGEGRQMRVMPDEDELVSKKENPIVDKIIHEPMDDGDIRSYFPKARVMRYADLADYDDIEELLPEAKSHVFLLYQHRPNDGHFVCIMRYANVIEFFCSYGSKIDGPLYWTSLPEREALGEGKPYLSMLLKKASKRFKAIHNPVAFQSKKDGVATCGAYCVMRINQLLNHNQDLHEFIDYMEELKRDTGLSYDEIVANYVNKR